MKKGGCWILLIMGLILITSLSYIGFVSGFNFFDFNNKNILQVTSEHPFLVDGKWLVASELNVGDELFLIDRKKAKITNIIDINSDEEISVYNLEAETYSNFILSDGIVVHNSNNPTEAFSEIQERLNAGKRTADEKIRIDRANELLEEKGLPKLSSVEQENQLLLAHYSETGNIDKVWRLSEAGLNNEQIKLLGDNWVFGIPEIEVSLSPTLRGKAAESTFDPSKFSRYTRNIDDESIFAEIEALTGNPIEDYHAARRYFKDNGLILNNGQPIKDYDTLVREISKLGYEGKMFKWVIDNYGDLYIGFESAYPNVPELTHGILAFGEDIIAGGEIKLIGNTAGDIKLKVNPQTGHYVPREASIKTPEEFSTEALDALRKYFDSKIMNFLLPFIDFC